MVFIGAPDTEPFVRAAGLTFVTYCEEGFPLGSMTQAYAPESKLHGFVAVRYTCEKVFAPLTRAALKHLQGKLEETGSRATTAASILLHEGGAAAAILMDGFEGWSALPAALRNTGRVVLEVMFNIWCFLQKLMIELGTGLRKLR